MDTSHTAVIRNILLVSPSLFSVEKLFFLDMIWSQECSFFFFPQLAYSYSPDFPSTQAPALSREEGEDSTCILFPQKALFRWD